MKKLNTGLTQNDEPSAIKLMILDYITPQRQYISLQLLGVAIIIYIIQYSTIWLGSSIAHNDIFALATIILLSIIHLVGIWTAFYAESTIITIVALILHLLGFMFS